jgi:hypothetical protein
MGRMGRFLAYITAILCCPLALRAASALVPEPGAAVALLVPLAGLLARRRRGRR